MLNVNEVTRLYLGVQGENEARSIVIDVSPWLVANPGGSLTIWHKRHGELTPSATGAVFDDQEGTLTWTPTNTDTYYAGEGEAEIRLTEGSVIKKSRTVLTGVSESVTLNGSVLGSDWQSYINAVDGIRAAAVTAKQAAEAAQSAAETAQGKAEDAQEAAETAQGKAEDAQEAAEAAQTAAEYAQGKAEDAQTGAEGAESAAVSAKNAAVSAKNDAVDAKNAALGAKTAAQTAQGLAETAQGKAEDAQTAAETAQGLAESAQGLAESARDTAARWATGSDEGTPGATNNAQYYAGQASNSATSASGSAGSASTSANAANASAGTAGAEALKAEGYARGKQNGTDVGSDSPYYHASAKYYSEEAADSETAAGSSATAAAADALKAEGFAVGEQNGTAVASGSPYYHKNAEYFKDQAAASASHCDDVAESIPQDYTTLSNEVSDLKSALTDFTGNEDLTGQFVARRTYNTNESTVDLSNPNTENGWASALIECSAGDKFTVTGKGGNSTRLWAFVDDSTPAVVKKVAVQAATKTDEVIEAPTDAAYLIVNVNSNFPYKLNTGKIIERRVTALETEAEAIPNISVNRRLIENIYGESVEPYEVVSVISNGNFAEGSNGIATGLTVYDNGTYSLSNGVQSVQTSTIDTRLFTRAGLGNAVGDKIYVSVMHKSAYGIKIIAYGTEMYDNEYGSGDGFEFISGIVNGTNTNTNVTILERYQYHNVHQFMNLNVINLTSIFGSDIPSKAEIDKYVLDNNLYISNNKDSNTIYIANLKTVLGYDRKALVTEFEYNGDYVSKITTKCSGATISEEEYEYDNNGNVVERTVTENGYVTTYTYSYNTVGGKIKSINKTVEVEEDE